MHEVNHKVQFSYGNWMWNSTVVLCSAGEGKGIVVRVLDGACVGFSLQQSSSLWCWVGHLNPSPGFSSCRGELTWWLLQNQVHHWLWVRGIVKSACGGVSESLVPFSCASSHCMSAIRGGCLESEFEALSARTQIQFSYIAVLVPLSSCITGHLCLFNKVVGTGAEKIANNYFIFCFLGFGKLEKQI